MPRVLKNKELVNMRLATNYGGWMYCDKCQKNIGYLCYSTYDKLDFNFKCNCGGEGKALIEFEDSTLGKVCNNELVIIKNRLCCPKDNEPLITILDKKLISYNMKVTCKSCGNIYIKNK